MGFPRLLRIAIEELLNSGQDKRNESDTGQLIQTVQKKSLDDNTRYSALSILILRFRGSILKTCEFICKNHGHGHVTAEWLANEVFERFYEKGSKFNINRKSKVPIDDLFELYLNKIARNALVDLHRNKERKENNPYDGTEIIQRELPKMSEEQFVNSKIEVRLLYKVVNSFSQSHRTIYLTYKTYKKEGFTLPRKLLKNLREELNLTQNTVNRYLKEVTDAVDAAIENYVQGMKDSK